MSLRNATRIFAPLVITNYAMAESVIAPAGPAAASLSRLTLFVLIVFSIVTVVMWVLLGAILRRPRGSFEEHAPVDAGGGESWVLIGGFAIPTVILAIIFVMGLQAMARSPVHEGMPGMEMDPPAIRVIGHQWWWEVQYLEGPLELHFSTANEIHIPTGRAVEVELLSRDVIHSFWVPELNGKVDLVPGQPNRITLQAGRAGTYRGQCSEFCGVQHAHMGIIVVADPPDAYQEWLNNQRAEAVHSASDINSRGRKLFEDRPCQLCHTIRGSTAHGTVGPDLTHLASRQGIAANTVNRNDATLSAWVTHAQSLKPGSRMPDLPQFSGTELRALVSYLETLQ